MGKRKACKQCKLFVEGPKCPACGFESFSDAWQGRIYINDAERSQIARNVNIKAKGEYAIKVR